METGQKLLNLKIKYNNTYSGRKITESLGNVTVRGEKYGKSKRGARLSTVCLSMYSITENIYCSQLSSVAILLQPESISHRMIQGKHSALSLSLSTVVLPSSPSSHVSTSNGQRSSQLFCVHYTPRCADSMLCLRSEDALVITCVANVMEVKVLYVQQDLRYAISSYWLLNV
jgi:hypothetical protein